MTNKKKNIMKLIKENDLIYLDKIQSIYFHSLSLGQENFFIKSLLLRINSNLLLNKNKCEHLLKTEIDICISFLDHNFSQKKIDAIRSGVNYQFLINELNKRGYLRVKTNKPNFKVFTLNDELNDELNKAIFDIDLKEFQISSRLTQTIFISEISNCFFVDNLINYFTFINPNTNF